MKWIEICNLNWEELVWLAKYTLKIKEENYEIIEVKRDENLQPTITLKSISLSKEN